MNAAFACSPRSEESEGPSALLPLSGSVPPTIFGAYRMLTSRTACSDPRGCAVAAVRNGVLRRGHVLTQRRRSVQAKLDRGYDDYLQRRISDGFCTRKAEEWESELSAINTEQGRLSRPTPTYAATGEKILELAKTAHFQYLQQSFVERRWLLDSVLSNCTFDRGTLCPTYVKPFDLLSQGNETGNWRGRRDSNPRPPA